MDLIQRDLAHIWHPCSQMKDYKDFPPLQIKSAKGAYLETTDGKKVIDAISSWWCKSLGHGHPRIKRAVKDQIEKFEHVILANTTNELIVQLSENLSGLTHSLDKVFYAGDGSMAVEIALKMSLHSQLLKGNSKKSRFMALENGYHGESAAALGVSEL
ncbi:MAG: aminotransferase class III-fold pyridoxal phosphate-dependent enzyme, partial [Fibrobacteria bacterium]|nr:aminotransferase class III-fold pyridoxal phosphate-dependent enzyme [Fibrobacteria bacterium]